jgi:cyclopropane-fatty-acyl-phospholipid synthase
MSIGSVMTDVLGSDLPIRIRAFDGTDLGPRTASTTLTVKSPEALIRIVTAPGELGLARAYVGGEIEISGSIYDVLELRRLLPHVRFTPSQIREFIRLVGLNEIRRIPPPPEEHRRARGHLHSRGRDANAVSHHYDVSNQFYKLVLGPSMTYSCALFAQPYDTLEQAQEYKHELVCVKLGLRPGMRLLDIGCGWGSMAIHAARHHGAEVVGITISQNQVDLARERVAEAGVADRVEIRLQDYRDVDDRPFDAISSIGMFEHVGLDRLGTYFDQVLRLLVPGGRLLNHAISRTGTRPRIRLRRSRFIDRYVFPDGELHEVGAIISSLHDHGFDVRHMEGLREHYALTLRRWVSNLEANWDAAVAETSEGRARVWRLYMAASAVNFEDNHLHVDQVLAVNPSESGRSSTHLRPEWQ